MAQDIPIFGVKIPLYASLIGKDGCIVGEIEGWALSAYDGPELYAVCLVGNGPDGLGAMLEDTHDHDMDFYYRHLEREASKEENLRDLADKWWEWRKDQIANAGADREVNAQKEAALG